MLKARRNFASVSQTDWKPLQPASAVMRVIGSSSFNSLLGSAKNAEASATLCPGFLSIGWTYFKYWFYFFDKIDNINIINNVLFLFFDILIVLNVLIVLYVLACHWKWWRAGVGLTLIIPEESPNEVWERWLVTICDQDSAWVSGAVDPDRHQPFFTSQTWWL